MGVGNLHGGTFRNLNMSITKTWTFRERYSAEFRAEIHNLPQPHTIRWRLPQL